MESDKDAIKIVHQEALSGVTVGYRQAGSGTPVILVHGIGVSSAYFTFLAQELSPHYTVFALDFPGYGKTPKPNHPLTIPELTKVLHSFIKRHGIVGPVLIGHSMGSQIVTQFQQQYPRELTKAILMSPTVFDKERTPFMQGVRLLQDTFLEPPKVNAIIFSDYLRMGIARYLQTSRFMIAHHIERYIDKTPTPILIIRGSRDPIVPKSWVKKLARLSPLITAREIQDGAHAVHATHAKTVGDVCKDFIEQ